MPNTTRDLIAKLEEEIQKINVVLKNGIKNTMNETKNKVDDLQLQITRIETQQQSYESRVDDMSKLINDHFKKVYSLIIKSHDPLKNDNNSWQKVAIITLIIVSAMSTIDYVIRIFTPNAPDMHLLSVFVELFKGIL